MSYFGLVETIFKGDSPISILNQDLLGSQTHKYPLDLGSMDKAHYIVFYAKKQTNSQTTSPGSSPVNNIISGATNYANEITGGLISQVGDTVKEAKTYLNNTLNSITSNVNDLFGSLTGNSTITQNLIQNSIKQVKGSSLFDFTRLTQTSDIIALYMPQTIIYGHFQHYERMELGGEGLARLILAPGKSAIDSYNSGSSDVDKRNRAVSSVVNSAVLEGIEAARTSGIGNAVGLGGGAGRLISAAATGVVANPLLEVLYSSPDFRTFNFEFMFYPRSPQEALEVQNIINKFYYHQAPEIVKESQGFLIPPSQFDIEMKFNGSSNPNIPTITTCVLETIQVNYAPQGFTTYEIPTINTATLGGTGMPVAIQLVLGFREISYLTKEDFSG